jgi:hypothetical protein
MIEAGEHGGEIGMGCDARENQPAGKTEDYGGHPILGKKTQLATGRALSTQHGLRAWNAGTFH